MAEYTQEQANNQSWYNTDNYYDSSQNFDGSWGSYITSANDGTQYYKYISLEDFVHLTNYTNFATNWNTISDIPCVSISNWNQIRS